MPLLLEPQIVPLNTDADGVMRVGASRVPLETVVHAFDQGHTAEEIVSRYPALRLADVYAVIAYYLNTKSAVQSYIESQTNAAQQVWEQIEPRPDYQSFRQKLLARKQSNLSHG